MYSIMSWPSILTLFLTLICVNGQGFEGAGSCGRSCGTGTIARYPIYGCGSASDISCLCSRDAFIFALRDCASQACPANERAQDIASFNALCPGKSALFQPSSAASSASTSVTSASSASSIASTSTSSQASSSTSSSSAVTQSTSQPSAAAPASTATSATHSAYTTFTSTGTVNTPITSAGGGIATFSTQYTFTSTVTDPAVYSSLLQQQQQIVTGSVSPTSTAAPASTNTTLSTGAKIGIGVGVGVGGALIVTAIVFAVLARRRRNISYAAVQHREKNIYSPTEERPMEFASFRYETNR